MEELIRQLRERRRSLVAEMERIVGDAPGAALSFAETRAFQANQAETRAIDERIADLEESMGREAAAADLDTKLNRPATGEGPGGFLRAAGPEGENDVLLPAHRLVDWARSNRSSPETEDLSFGRYIRGIVTGRWEGADRERRAQTEGTLGTGGYLVPTPLAAEVIDKARAEMRVMQAGALTVPMTSQTLKIARITGDPAAVWHAENAALADSTMTFDAVTFTAQTLLALVKLSVEVFEDSQLLVNTVEDTFAKAIALELDRASLRGTGTSPEPRGVLNTSGISVTTIGGANGATPTWDNVVDSSIAPLSDANFAPSGIIWAPRTARTLAKAKDSQLRYLDPPTIAREIPKLETTQVPVNLTVGTSTDCSEIYDGEWSKLAIGMRTEFSVAIVDQRFLTDNFQFALIAYLRADVQLLQPAAFSVVKGVRP